MGYGIAWMGSKSRWAKWILSHIPREPVLVDLFAGGCAIADAALERGQRVIACDRDPAPLELFDSILRRGMPPLPPEPRTKQELLSLDLLGRICWPFGARQDTLGGKAAQIRARERWNAMHAICNRKRAPGGWIRYHAGDSMQFEPPADCVIYADPPYTGTGSYNRGYQGPPVREANTHAVIARLRELGRPWLLSEKSNPEGLDVVDTSYSLQTFTATGAARTEYLLTEPRWRDYFIPRLL